jgi:hypothetical protein
VLDEAKGLIDDGMYVDRFLVQLMAFEHRSMAQGPCNRPIFSFVPNGAPNRLDPLNHQDHADK